MPNNLQSRQVEQSGEPKPPLASLLTSTSIAAAGLPLPFCLQKFCLPRKWGSTLFRVTKDTYVGRFASRERLGKLRDLYITDVLNVSDTPSQLTTADGPFPSVSWFDIEDRVLIPIDKALNAIDVIHRSLTADGGRIYVHCIAGWNRSPTVIWLYLLACGIPTDDAARLICAQAFDAVPGHALLVDSNLIATVQSHGRVNYLPHRRPGTITAT